jgi:hypothetical protein
VRVSAVLRSGYGVASGRAADSPYPAGTIALQTPYFQALGLDLTPFFPGTLNLSIAPHTFKIQQPEYTFKQVKWSPAHAAEDFSFSRCRVEFRGVQYASLVYYPHPETKIDHFQDAALLEILAVKIPDIQPGDRVSVDLNSHEILLLE